jgi:hypothetical protein
VSLRFALNKALKCAITFFKGTSSPSSGARSFSLTPAK